MKETTRSMEQAAARRVFVHDGSFPGFLCATAELLNAVLSAGGRGMPAESSSPRVMDSCAVRGPAAGIELFEEEVRVPRDDGRARKLWERMEARVGEDAALPIMEAFLSDVAGADEAAAAMAARLWKEGTRALDDLTDPRAAVLEAAALRTAHESHRFLGFVRFSELSDGSWYARIDPGCDVLPFIGDHFSARFPGMRWAIHDGRRGTAILHEPGKAWFIAENFAVAPTPRGDLPLSEAEIVLRDAWRRYFASVTIDSRLNPRLQAHFLPKKHWNNLPEMENAAGGTSMPSRGLLSP